MYAVMLTQQEKGVNVTYNFLNASNYQKHGNINILVNVFNRLDPILLAFLTVGKILCTRFSKNCKFILSEKRILAVLKEWSNSFW